MRARLYSPKTWLLALAILLPGLAIFSPSVSSEIIRSNGPGGVSGGGGTTLPVSDATSIVEGSADGTKELRFEVDGFTTGTTRVVTIPNADVTMAHISASTQTFGGRILLSPLNGMYFTNVESGASPGIFYRTEQTPDAPVLSTGSTSRSYIVAESDDVTTDFGHALAIHPTFFFQSSDATVVTQYSGVSATGIRGELFKALTESAATSFVQIPVAAASFAAGQVVYTIFASDGTDHQTRTGSIYWGAVNKAAVETCGAPTEVGTSLANVSLGTLTVTWTCDTTPANAVNLQANAVSSLTQTTLRIYYKVILNGPGEPLPQ